MSGEQLLAWITERYGEPTAQHANGVFIMAVRVMGGIAIGCGSSATNAVYDLHCDLSLPPARQEVKGLRLQPWEAERRMRIDAARKKKLPAESR